MKRGDSILVKENCQAVGGYALMKGTEGIVVEVLKTGVVIVRFGSNRRRLSVEHIEPKQKTE